MSAEEIRLKAQAAHWKAGRNLIVALAMCSLLLILSSAVAISSYRPQVRAIAAAIVVLTATVAYSAYHRLKASYMSSADAGLKGCVDFYRKELKAQYRSAALMWKLVAPLAIFTFLSWRDRTNPYIPRIFLPSVLILILVVRRLQTRKVRQQLVALDEFEKENPLTHG